MYDPEDMKGQGKLTEGKFMEWLNSHEIPFWYIQQDRESFSGGLKEYRTKRPDFMLLVPHVGSLFVDVTNKTSAEKYGEFRLDGEEIRRLSNLQNFFNLQVWYVLSNEGCHHGTWYWIPVSKVLKERLYRPKGYYGVKMEKFIQVASSDNQGLGRVFSEIAKLR